MHKTVCTAKKAYNTPKLVLLRNKAPLGRVEIMEMCSIDTDTHERLRTAILNGDYGITTIGKKRGTKFVIEETVIPKSDNEIAEEIYLFLKESDKEHSWKEIADVLDIENYEIRSSNIQSIIKKNHGDFSRGSKRGLWCVPPICEEKIYLVTEADLKAFYHAMGRVADALMKAVKEIDDPDLSHFFENTWDDNVGGTFEYMFEGQKLRSHSYWNSKIPANLGKAYSNRYNVGKAYSNRYNGLGWIE